MPFTISHKPAFLPMQIKNFAFEYKKHLKLFKENSKNSLEFEMSTFLKDLGIFSRYVYAKFLKCSFTFLHMKELLCQVAHSIFKGSRV